MKQILVLSIALVHHVKGNNNDLFNYRETDDNDYGPEDWDQVTCDDVEICVSQPTMFSRLLSVSFGILSQSICL